MYNHILTHTLTRSGQKFRKFETKQPLSANNLTNFYANILKVLLWQLCKKLSCGRFKDLHPCLLSYNIMLGTNSQSNPALKFFVFGLLLLPGPLKANSILVLHYDK